MRYALIPGGNGFYKAGTDGSLWTRRKRHKWKKLNPSVDRFGYPETRLKLNGRYTTVKVHYLILTTFRGPRPPNKVARHFPDRDPNNNTLINLHWASQRRNIKDRLIHGTDNSGERHGMAKLTNDDAEYVREVYRHGWAPLLAKFFGVHPSTITRIANKTSFRRT